jgi:hypothetical protein
MDLFKEVIMSDVESMMMLPMPAATRTSIRPKPLESTPEIFLMRLKTRAELFSVGRPSFPFTEYAPVMVEGFG